MKYVRVQMIVIIAATVAAGAAASKVMLMAGLTDVAIRFPMATLLACAAFAWFTKLWAGYVSPQRRSPGTEAKPLRPEELGFDLFLEALGELGLAAFAIGAALYTIWTAASILEEVAPAGTLALFQKTWVAWVAILVLMIGLGNSVHSSCPGATKLSEAIVCAARPVR